MILVCIPARNEEATIARVLVKVKQHADMTVVCDDGSNDMTPEVAGGLGAEVIKNGVTGGYGAALRLLFKRAVELDPDVMVTLDADGQHDADQIQRLVKPVLDGEADVVIGSRFLGRSEHSIPTHRKVGIKIITHLTDVVSGLRLTDVQSGFRAYGRRAFRNIVPAEAGMGASTEILMRAAEEKLQIREVPVDVSYRGLKTSNSHPVYHGIEVIASVIKFVSARHTKIFY